MHERTSEAPNLDRPTFPFEPTPSGHHEAIWDQGTANEVGHNGKASLKHGLREKRKRCRSASEGNHTDDDLQVHTRTPVQTHREPAFFPLFEYVVFRCRSINEERPLKKVRTHVLLAKTQLPSCKPFSSLLPCAMLSVCFLRCHFWVS